MWELISNETFLKIFLILCWFASLMLTVAVARYKNRNLAWGWLGLLLGLISLIWLLLLPKVSEEKAVLRMRRELIILNQAYSIGIWRFKLNNSNLLGLYTKILRRNEEIDMECIDSFTKIAIEEKKNTVWSLAYVSVICSFVISFSVTILGNLLKGGLNHTLTSSITDSVFSLIMCTFVAIGIAGFIHKYTYSKLLYFQEAIRLHKLNRQNY